MKFHTIGKISFSGNQMTLEVDSKQVTVDLTKVSPRLAAATAGQRMNYEVSPSGYGIHWPDLDEDLSVDGLLGLKHVPKTKFAESVAEDNQTAASAKPTMLERLIKSSDVQAMNKANKLTLIAAVLHSNDSEGFKQLDNLTWPEGQAILLASSRDQITKTNTTAQLHSVPNSPYFIDTGHDNASMQRLIELMMRKLGYELGLINRTKKLFEVAPRHKPGDYY